MPLITLAILCAVQADATTDGSLSIPAADSSVQQETAEEFPLLRLKADFDTWLYVQEPSAELALDFNLRQVYVSGQGHPGTLSWIGLDFIDELRWDGRSIGSLLLQPFLMRADGLPKTPAFFDDDHDWALQWRLVYADITRWEHRGLSWKTGHLEVPFGLERIIDTNGTLRQYTNQRNLGVKADWGTSLHGEQDVDYEIAVTRGSGNEYREKDDNYVVAARVGNSRDEDLTFGFSYMHANLSGQDIPGNLTSFPKPRRRRAGADFRWRLPRWTLLGEASTGENDGDDVWSALLEANAHSFDERMLLYVQLLGSGTEEPSGWSETETIQAGFRTEIGPNMTVSTIVTRDVSLPEGRDPLSSFMLQCRFRF